MAMTCTYYIDILCECAYQTVNPLNILQVSQPINTTQAVGLQFVFGR